jgi:hypothetical protein
MKSLNMIETTVKIFNVVAQNGIVDLESVANAIAEVKRHTYDFYSISFDSIPCIDERFKFLTAKDLFERHILQSTTQRAGYSHICLFEVSEDTIEVTIIHQLVERYNDVLQS